jgi:hypothetical protein
MAGWKQKGPKDFLQDSANSAILPSLRQSVT